ncbi:hypothetical protein [Streptomyces sp. NPDC005141]
MSTPSGHPALFATARPEDARLESLRSRYEADTIAGARRAHRTVRVAPYVLAAPGTELGADLELIEAHVHGKGWHVTRSSFGDAGQAPAIGQRSGFAEAFVYAAQGFAHGIVAIGRAAITTDNEAYADVLEQLHRRGVFLAYLPTTEAPGPL